MDNPFKIKPGEILNLDQVFERYLDWQNWNSEHDASKRGKDCDVILHRSNLCCVDHMNLNAEYGVFFDYFFLLTHDDTVYASVGFSAFSMRDFIRKNGINVEPRKVAKHHRMTEREWRQLMK